MAKEPKPPCPRPAHDESHVVFDGHYGKSGHRRQRYRCYPNSDKSEFHRRSRLPSTSALGGRLASFSYSLEIPRVWPPRGFRKVDPVAKPVRED